MQLSITLLHLQIKFNRTYTVQTDDPAVLKEKRALLGTARVSWLLWEERALVRLGVSVAGRSTSA